MLSETGEARNVAKRRTELSQGREPLVTGIVNGVNSPEGAKDSEGLLTLTPLRGFRFVVAFGGPGAYAPGNDTGELIGVLRHAGHGKARA